MKRIKTFNLKKQKKNIARVLIVAFLLYVIFIIIADIRKIFSVSATFHWSIIPVVLLCTLFSYLFRALRFQYLLKKIHISFSFFQSFTLFLAGIAMTVTPGKIGEAVKSYLIKQRTGHGYTQTIPLLLFERVMDGIAMIILSLGGIYLFKRAGVLIFFLFSSFLVVLFFILIYDRRPIIFFTRLIEKHFSIILSSPIHDFFDQSRALMRLQTMSVSLFLSLVAWVLQGIALYILVQSLKGVVQIPVVQGVLYALFIFSFSSIAAFLALIPAGLGIAEGSLVSFLSLFFHLNLIEAVFVSLVFRFTTLWFGVAIGAVFLVRSFKSVQQPQFPKE